MYKDFTMKYILLFAFIQLVALVLAVVGVPICAVLAYGEFSHASRDGWHWPKWAWIWDNDEDGTFSAWYHAANPTWSFARTEFVWTALRNPVNNFRYVRGVSKVGRPLWRQTWGAKPGGWYVAAGWNNSGYPILSGGRNVNPY